MDIRIHDIPHREQRYETVGDWLVFDGNLKEIHVSTMEPIDYSFLVALHELVEAWLCLKRGITDEEVTAFDMEFEKHRAAKIKSLKGDGTTREMIERIEAEEPGDSPDAPYFKEHRFATKIERLMAEEMGVNWDEYDAAVRSL